MRAVAWDLVFDDWAVQAAALMQAVEDSIGDDMKRIGEGL